MTIDPSAPEEQRAQEIMHLFYVQRRKNPKNIDLEAFAELVQLAEGGSVNATSGLAALMGDDTFPVSDKKMSLKWTARAAKMGDTKSKSKLAAAYSQGSTILDIDLKSHDEDYRIDRMIELSKACAEEGDRHSISRLWIHYKGLDPDSDKTAYWLLRAAYEARQETAVLEVADLNIEKSDYVEAYALLSALQAVHEMRRPPQVMKPLRERVEAITHKVGGEGFREARDRQKQFGREYAEGLFAERQISY